MATKTAKQMATEIRAIPYVEWAKDYDQRVVIQLTGCGRVRKGARLSVEADGSLNLSKLSDVAVDAFADQIAAIRAVLA